MCALHASGHPLIRVGQQNWRAIRKGEFPLVPNPGPQLRLARWLIQLEVLVRKLDQERRQGSIWQSGLRPSEGGNIDFGL